MALNYSRNQLVDNASLVAAINDELEKIDVALQDGLSRSGSTPNALESTLDGGGQDFVNVGALSVQSLTVGGGEVPSLNDIIDTYDAAIAAKDAAEDASSNAQDAADSAAADAAAAALSEAAAGVSETNAASSEATASAAATAAGNSETAAATSESNAANSEAAALAAQYAAELAQTFAGTAATNAADSASAAATDADDAETARIAAEAAAAGVNLPSVPSGSEGQFLRVNSAEDGYELNEFYEYTTVSLSGSGDFIDGTLMLARVGEVVTITSDSNISHADDSAVVSATSVLPISFRPSTTVTSTNGVLLGIESQDTMIFGDGTVGLRYSGARSASLVPINISYVIQPST